MYIKIKIVNNGRRTNKKSDMRKEIFMGNLLIVALTSRSFLFKVMNCVFERMNRKN